jgi:hypothetical protein
MIAWFLAVSLLEEYLVDVLVANLGMVLARECSFFVY